MLHPLLVALATVLATLAISVQPAPSKLDQYVYGQMEIPLPVNFCTVPEAVAALVRRGHLVAGIEYLPGDCNAERFAQPRSGDPLLLHGLTIREALDKLVQVDG